MPSRMIHYLVAEEVAKRIPVRDMNRFKIGSLCPDMSSRENESKNITHFQEIAGEIKGANWGDLQRNTARTCEGMICILAYSVIS